MRKLIGALRRRSGEGGCDSRNEAGGRSVLVRLDADERFAELDGVRVVCENLDDLCFPVDLGNPTAEALCLQDCTDPDVTCESGSCDPIPGATGSLCGWLDAGGTGP